MNYRIISDGCCDLTKDIIEKYDLHIIPFYISFDSEHYYKEIEEIGIREVYDKMVGDPKTFPKTSLPSLQNYMDAFEQYVKEDIPVVCICFTPSLSGSYNCACNAKEIVCEKYPEAKISVINSEAATVSQWLMVIEAARMRQDGISYEECVRILEEMKKTNHIFFTVGNLDYLKQGGRIGKLAGLAAGALSLKPIIVLEYGEISSSGIGRSRKKTLQKTMEVLKKYFKEKEQKISEYDFCVGYGYDIEEGKEYYRYAKEQLEEMCSSVKVACAQIGATIAVHTGPHAIGVGCIRRYEYYLS